MVPMARTTELELARPRAADAPRIAAIHLRAMQANPLLWAQFPSEESQHELEKFLTGYYAAFCCGDGTRYGNVGEQVSALAEDQTLISCCRGSTGFGNANVGTGDQTISLTEDENSESCCGGGAGFKKASNEGGDQTLDLVEERQSSSCCGGSTSLKVESKNNSQKLPLAPSQSTEQEPGCADKENGLLVARDSRTGEVVGFVKWDAPNHNKNEADLESTKEKLESGDIRNIEGCRPEYLEGYAMAAEAVRKRAFGDRECYNLNFLCVDPAHQSRGAGTLLTRAVLDRAAHARLPVYLESTESAVRMYERLGFQILDSFDMEIPRRGTSKEGEGGVVGGGFQVYKEWCMVWDPPKVPKATSDDATGTAPA